MRYVPGAEQTLVDVVVPADQGDRMGDSVGDCLVVVIRFCPAVVIAGGGDRAVFGDGSFDFRNPLFARQTGKDQARAFETVESVLRDIRLRGVARDRTLPHT